MQSYTIVVLAAIVAMALAEGQFYVPRSYYIIDAEGHESAPVPLRRLRRSLAPYPYISGAGGYGGGYGGGYPGSSASANANANANANSWGNSDATANANANAHAGGGSGGWGNWGAPGVNYGSSKPGLRAGQSVRQAGPVSGRSVTASSSVGVDSSGQGYYDQYASVN